MLITLSLLGAKGFTEKIQIFFSISLSLFFSFIFGDTLSTREEKERPLCRLKFYLLKIPQ